MLEQLWPSLVEKSITSLIISSLIVVPAVCYIAWVLLRYTVHVLKRVWRFVRSRRRALRAVERDFAENGAFEGKGVWLTKPINPPEDYWRKVAASKTLAIANLKGGVGKTTLAANIGAYLAKDWQKRVLLIDLDFQGSLSSMAFPTTDWLPAARQSSLAVRLISGDIAPGDVRLLAPSVELNAAVGSAGRLQVMTAYYDLAQADNRIMVEWLLHSNSLTDKGWIQAARDRLKGRVSGVPDVRYTLAEILHSDAVQKAFDIIIIDCPPRLTTSKIQAFCAASHLLIPTIFDRTSAEAVVSLCEQVEILKREGICVNLKYIGVVGTMWRQGRAVQTRAMTMVKDILRSGPTGILPESTFVPHTAALVNDAADGIAHLVMPFNQDSQRVRLSIAALAERVAGQMGIRQPVHFREAAE
jgi:chromosome partitioning protein